MRINKFIAAATGLSRRKADEFILAGRVTVNGQEPLPGEDITDQHVLLDGKALQAAQPPIVLLLNKPTGYVCSRSGQGSKTIYDLLPAQYHHLKPVGRLDKNSSGLLILTNDGQLAYELTHPKFNKQKVYQIVLDKPLQPLHRQMINDHGLQLEDGLSKLQLERLDEGDDTRWCVTMSEGRNRQIRRTFASVGYEVIGLSRTQFGIYALDSLADGQYSLTDA